MGLRSVIAIAALSLMPALAFADGVAPDYSGEMTIVYTPIMCLVEPCPPGNYSIMMDGKTVAEGDVIFIESEDGSMQYRGMYLDIDTVTADLWIGGEGKLDYDGIGIPDGGLLLRLAQP